MALLKSELSEEELENLKSLIMRLQRKEVIYYFVFTASVFAVLETLPFLNEFFTGRDAGASLRIALEDYARNMLVVLLMALARYYPYFFKKMHFDENVTESVRGFIKKGFCAAVLMAFLISLFYAIKTYVDTGDAYVYPDYIYPDVILFILFFLIECIFYFVRLYVYTIVLDGKIKSSEA